jgi:2-haloalkanoic acid dehalogenase type II
MTHPDFDVATFDCFGTLIDWEGGLANFLYDVALQHEALPQENGHTMRERWEAIQFGIIQGDYRLYKVVLAESLRLWMQERGYPWNDSFGEALVRSMRSWQPFPDTRPALTRVREQGKRLIILSNTDNDLIAHSLRHLEIPFDDVITAEDCQSYKPSPRNFERLVSRIGVPPERALHVAFGFKYDIGPAQRLGMKTAWVNRKAEAAPGAERPDYVWRDLWGLAEL